MPVLAINKRANYDYEILEDYEAGLVLVGHEVKAAKAGQVSLKGSHVVFSGSQQGQPQAYLLNAHISLYRLAGTINDYDPTRSRRLLLNKKQLNHLFGRTSAEGLTVVPLKLYTKGSLLKLAIALVRGKKKFDKRRAIKERDWERQRRTLTKQAK
jgi:SsrA-binding protein